MAKDILIVPGSSNIHFSGSAVNDIRLETLDSGSVAFTSNSGSILTITNSFTGSLFSVGDVSGVPILDVNSDDTVTLGQFSSPIKVLTNASGHTIVSGSSTSSGSFGRLQASTIAGNSPIKIDSQITFTDGTASAPSMTFSSDTNTGMYRVGADDIGFTTGGTERFRIDSSGNLIIRANDKHLYGLTSGNATISLIGVRGDNYVEIGHSGYGVVTGTGNWALDGADNMTVLASAYFAEYLYHYGDTDTYLRFQNNKALVYGGGSGIVVDGGNVGIGATSPSAKLHVIGDAIVTGNLTAHQLIVSSSVTNMTVAQASGSTIFGNSLDDTHQFTGSLYVSSSAGIEVTSASPILRLNDKNVSGLYHRIIGGGNAGLEIGADLGNVLSSAYIRFDVGNSEKVRIVEDGSVGIGETSPLAKLHVKTSAVGDSALGTAVDDFVIEGSGLSGMTILSTTEGGIAFGDASDTVAGSIWYNHSNDAMSFYVNNGTRMHIASDGKVGIGTTAPGVATLNVFSTTPFLYVGDGTPNNDSTWDANIMLDSNQHSRIRIENRGDNKNLEIFSHTGYNPMIRATDSGTGVRMGVGGTVSLTIGTSPYLNVHGTTYISGNVGIGNTSPGYKVDITGDIRSTGVAYFNSYVRTDQIRPTGTNGIEISNSQGNIVSYLAPRGSGAAASGIRITDNFNMMFGSDNDYSIAYHSTRDTLEFVNGVDFAATRMVIDSSGRVGIGDTTPSYTLDVSGKARVTQRILIDNSGTLGIDKWNIKKFSAAFTNAQSNRAVNIEFGNNYFQGYIDVIVTSGYSNQNSVGKLHKRWYYGFNVDGTIWQAATGRVVESFGPIHNQITLVNPSWDSSNSKYILPIVHTVSTGNTYSIVVKTNAAGYTDPDNITLSSEYNYGSSPSNEYPAIYAGVVESIALNSQGHSLIKQSLRPYNGVDAVGNLVLKSDGVTVATLYDSGAAGHARFHNFIRNADGTAAAPSYTFDNDADSGMYRPGNDEIAFSAGGTERMRVNSSGRVGIGTTNPQSSLHSVGTWNNNLILQGTGGDTALRFMDSDGNTDGYVYGSGASVGFLDNGGSWTIKATNDTGIYFYTNGGTEHMRIASDGDVSIGTTNNSGQLHVAGVGGSSSPVLYLQMGDSNEYNHFVNAIDANLTAGENGIIVFGQEAASKNAAYIGYKHRSDHGDDNQLTLGFWSANNLVNILPNGRMGIGTETPTQMLDVVGDIVIGGSSDSRLKFYSSAARAHIAPDQNVELRFGYANSSDKIFYNSTTEIVKINSAGLTVSSGNILSNGGYIQTNTVNANSKLTGHSGGLEVQSSQTDYGGIYVSDTNGDFVLQLYGAGHARYGFLGTEWGSWDWRKEIGGRIYTNNQTTYYLQPETTSHFNALTTAGNVDIGAGLDVTGNITVTGTVDGVDIAALNTTVGNQVTTNTTQTIGGAKTLSSDLTLNHVNLKLNSGGDGSTGILRLFDLNEKEQGEIYAHTSDELRFWVANGSKYHFQNGGMDIAGDLKVDGTITARQFQTTIVSSSVQYASGSTKFGDTADDTHIFSGSVTIKSPSGDALILDDNNNASNDIAWAYNGTKQYYIHRLHTDGELYISSYGSGGAVNITGDSSHANMPVHIGYRLGIGNTGPAYPLDVTGNARVGNNLYMNSYGVLSWDSSTAEFRVYATSGNELKLSANGHNSHITIATGGNVGIGTTSPSLKLSVGSNTNEARAEIGTSGVTTWQSNVYSLLTIGVSGSHALTQDSSGTSAQWFNVYDTANKYRTMAGYGANWMYAPSTGLLSYRTTDATSSAGSQITDLTPKFSIDKIGKVGVGTDAPVEAITIRGTSNGTDGFAYPAIAGYTTTTKLWALEQHYGNEGRLALYHGGNLKVLFRASGSSYIDNGATMKFGIGTGSPSYKLDVSGNMRATGRIYANSGVEVTTGESIFTTSSSGNLILFGGNSYKGGIIRLYGGDSGNLSGNAGKIEFFTTEDTGNLGTAMMTLVDSKVGIGTTSPVQPLTVEGNISGSGNLVIHDKGSSLAATIRATDTTNGYGLAVESQGTANTRYNVIFRDVDGANIYGGIATKTGQVGFWGVGVSPAATLGSRLNVNGNVAIGNGYTGTAAPSNGMIVQGSVGIGTTSPDSMLEVYKDVNTTNAALLKANINYSALALMGSYQNGYFLPALSWVTGNNSAGVPKAQIRVFADSAGSKMYLGTSNDYSSGITNDAITIDASGNIGINDTSPSYKLDVNGTGRFTGKLHLDAAESLELSGIRGQAVGSQTSEFIQLYERVSIGNPSGWGHSSAGAPQYGLSVYGSVQVGRNGSGVLQMNGTTVIDASRNLSNIANASIAGGLTMNNSTITLDTGETVKADGGYVIADGNAGVIMRENGSNRIILNSNTLRPDGNNSTLLGSTSQRWSTINSVLGNYSGALTVAGTIYATGGSGTLNGDGANLGGQLDLSIGSQSSNQGSRIKLESGHAHGEFIIQARGSSTYSTGNIGIYRRTGATTFGTIMHIGGDGKIAIGTETPSAPFNVHKAPHGSGTNLYHQATFTDSSNAYNGSPKAGIAFAGQYNSTPSYIEFGGIMGVKSNTTHGDMKGTLKFLTNNGSNVQTVAMTITETQRVGIGRTPVNYPLEVAGHVELKSSGRVFLETGGAIADNGTNSWLMIPKDGSSLQSFYTAGTRAMVIDSSQRIGIGTTSPGYPLHVYNLGTGLKVEAAGESPYTQKIAEFKYIGNGNSLFIENIGGRPSININGNGLILGTGGYNRLEIGTSGDVGIGIAPNTNFKTYIYDNTSDANAWAMNVYQDGAAGNGVRIDIDSTDSTDFILQCGANGGSTEVLNVMANSRVGILDTTPSYALDVTGTIRATADVIAYSDERVKDNIETIENPLEKVKELRGVSYNRNDIEDKSKKIGVIAQEVEKVLPEVVEQDDEGKYSVAYGNMVGLLIESVKEQQKQIEELKSEIQELKDGSSK